MSRRQKVFIVILTVAGGVAFAVASPMALDAIYRWVAMLINPGEQDNLGYSGANSPITQLAFGVLGLVAGAGLARTFVLVGDKVAEWWVTMDTGERVTLFLGTFAGIITSMPFLLLLNSLNLGIYIPLAVIGLTLGFSALSVYALNSMAEILPWYKGSTRRGRRGLRILDTNVLIDGRIYDLARTGFLEGQLYVPGFVLDELQYIADSHDPLRRQRGRRGLDILRHLEADFPLEVRIHDRLAPDLNDGVDSRLVRLAKALGADIITNDFNLNRVASIQAVRVLSINDLAMAMRANVMPKEGLYLHIVREGNQPGQGIGYLEDGTMVVVDGGKEFLGTDVDVTVTQVIQTERGKMIFAEIDFQAAHDGEPDNRKNDDPELARKRGDTRKRTQSYGKGF
ncbi:MAG: TRAM domain-containing protein [Fimbriimonadaceae bacterium]|nr:MAG: Integral membrane protein (PIN domain superfamily) [Armatimonadetes bacterium OLB18]MBV6490294.1 putative PIN and TRAM-domain containing protein YacL [Fimbriimonadaceae bacterium]MCL4284072.1 TRAM domain-containing protein [Fimbriimonadaceae bacterium]MCZ7580428.1 TRAM domain-containing protein [Fimbriimonadaceae bacterium]QOJ12888.1 MAG: TRAM domain-containing protein [Chthonomonadaceae bacterium]